MSVGALHRSVGSLRRQSEGHRLGYRRIVQLLVFLVVVPTTLLLAVGIVLMCLGSYFNILFGVLTVCFVLMTVTGTVLVLVFLRREANLSQLQSDFVSKVSHELRTPLTSIRMFVETMDRSRGDSRIADQCLDALGQETARLTEVIERLLDWGRMEAGRKFFEMRPEEPSLVVRNAAQAISALRMHRPEITLSVEVEPDLPLIHVDRAAMVDAIVNLLSNAVKYGGVPPAVRLRSRCTPMGVAFEVTDNGMGIPRVEQRRIFDKFYRIDDRLSREREGSGLGLAIVKHIVKAHGGRVLLESTLGQGSTFRIIMPAVAGLSTRKAKPSEGEASP
jgi:two-component system phosphate regulon sensor histidine kinase PhoR